VPEWVEKAELAVANDGVIAGYVKDSQSRTRDAVSDVIQPMVSGAIAADGTIANAAGAAVQTDLAKRRVVQYAPVDTTAPVLGLSTTGAAADSVLRAAALPDGNANAFLLQTDAGQQLLRIRSADGTVDLLLSDWSLAYLTEKLGLGNGSAAGWDGAITEWWCNMVCEDPARNRVLIGCMDQAGVHWVLEARPGAPIRGVAVTSTPIADDHNTGAVVVLPDGSLTYVYNQHNQTSSLYAILGDADGSIDSLARNPVVTIAGGGPISYNQLTLIEKTSTATHAEVYAATRRNTDSWGMLKLTYDLVTRTVSGGDYQPFFSSPDQQCYTHVGPSFHNAAGQQLVPCTIGYNPELARRQNPDVYRSTINLETGEILYANDAATGQLGTAKLFSELTPALNRLAADWSRRLFYGSRTVVLYAEGPIASPDDWTYYAAFFAADGTYTRQSFGRAGKRVGYRADSNYLSGMAMVWTAGGAIICVARENAGTYTVEVWKRGRDGAWTSKTIYQSTVYQAIRPYWAGAMGWLYNQVVSYPSDAYIGAQANLRFVTEGTK
jgi:hypothetical protein